MKNLLNRIIIKLNPRELISFLFLVFLGLTLILDDWYYYACFDYRYSYNNLLYEEAVYVSAFDENDNTLKVLLYNEIYTELQLNNIEGEVILDTTSNYVVMYQKNCDSVWFTDWCVYVANQALESLKNKNPGLGCISGLIYVY